MDPLKPLSPREMDVVELLLQGRSNKLIALELGISERTVEFHLKNIYAKKKVSSRVELILKLGNPTGSLERGKLGSSTVDSAIGNAENRTGSTAVQSFGQESSMKNLLSRHSLMGVGAALLTGLTWMALMKRFGHMSTESIMPWVAPILLLLLSLGVGIGLVGKRNGNRAAKVFFSAAFGTGMGAISAIPLVGFVAYPLAKLGETLGLINRTAVSTEVASTLVVLSMLAAWLVVGAISGILMLHIGFKKQPSAVPQKTAGQSV